jgi:hypothetical protein
LERLATMPRRCVAALWRNALDTFAALLTLALGFSLVGLVLVVAIPLVALASLGWKILRHLVESDRLDPGPTALASVATRIERGCRT